MDVKANTMDLQRQLGFTGAAVDGIRGPKTNAALFEVADQGRLTVAQALVIIKPADITVPIASSENIAGVHPDLQKVIAETRSRSAVPFDVIEGVRSKERQAQLVKIKASKTHDSRHLTGHAVDLWPKVPATGKRLPSDAAFPKGSAEAKAADARLWADLRKIAATVKAVAKEHGVQIEWGGDWGWDAPHFQLNRKAYPA